MEAREIQFKTKSKSNNLNLILIIILVIVLICLIVFGIFYYLYVIVGGNDLSDLFSDSDEEEPTTNTQNNIIVKPAPFYGEFDSSKNASGKVKSIYSNFSVDPNEVIFVGKDKGYIKFVKCQIVIINGNSLTIKIIETKYIGISVMRDYNIDLSNAISVLQLYQGVTDKDKFAYSIINISNGDINDNYSIETLKNL